MNSNLRSCGKLEIAEALTADHDALRDGLRRAAAEPGPIGKAAERVAQLCLLHFFEEEESVLRAIELLDGFAPEHVRPDRAMAVPMIAQLCARHLALRARDNPINAAIEELLQEARRTDNREICELVSLLREHEQAEDEIMYPTLLFADACARFLLPA